MITEMTTTNTISTLSDLASEIEREHQAAEEAERIAKESNRISIEHARLCGELLTRVKGMLPHGAFLRWVGRNCRVGERQARNYMALSANWSAIEGEMKSAPGADLTLKQAFQLAQHRRKRRERAESAVGQPAAEERLIVGDCLDVMRGMEAGSIDLVFGSPPYTDARSYREAGHDLGIARDCDAWVEWMLDVTTEAHRVCRGPVIWVAAGVTRQRNYQPACEGLMWEWSKRGGDHQLYRPCVFHRQGVPGSGGNDYLRPDWEYILCFKHGGKLPWSDPTACGSSPKCGADGAHRVRQQDGSLSAPRAYTIPERTNPGNVISCATGGGKMGSPLCHENEAPMPEKLAEFFILTFCHPNGVVLDPFVGGGTTMVASRRLGRVGIGIDIRESQVELTRQRLAAEGNSYGMLSIPNAPDGPQRGCLAVAQAATQCRSTAGATGV